MGEIVRALWVTADSRRGGFTLESSESDPLSSSTVGNRTPSSSENNEVLRPTRRLSASIALSTRWK